MTPDPYTPPTSAGPDVPQLPDECPACGAGLATGWTEGHLRWFTDGSAMERFKGGRKIAGPSSFTVTLKPVRHPSRHCEACGLTMLLPE